MNVLILHQHFRTPKKGGALRSYYLAKSLVDHHVKVTVITAHNDKELRIENVEGINVYFLPIPYENSFDFTSRSWAFLKYVWSVVRMAGKPGHFKFCYAISTPLTVGLAALWMKRRYHLPFIFEVGDLWPEAPIQMGFISNPILKSILFRLEKSIYKSASSIVALSPSIKKKIEETVPQKKVHLIPNMADCDFFFPEIKKAELELKYHTNGKFVISYIGAIGLANGLDYFLECANLSSKAELPIQFFICGEGALLERLKGNARQLNLHNLSFVEFTNREGVKELLNVTDAAFICYKPVPVLETGSPNKFFDGLAAGKLIIINFGGWIKDEIEASECGIYVDAKHPTDFIKKITPFLTDARLLEKYQDNARRLGTTKYSRELITQKFVKMFK